jgi:hypothetical protein
MREAFDGLICHLEIQISGHRISLPIPAINHNHQIFRREKSTELLFNPPRGSIRLLAMLFFAADFAAGCLAGSSPVDAGGASQQRVEKLV